MSIRGGIAVLVALMAAVSAGFAGGRPDATPSGKEILGRVQSALAGVRDFTVTLDITVNLERMKVPPMHATMYFKQPDKTHFEADGFALLPKEGLAFSMGDFVSKYDVESVANDTLNGREEYRLGLVAKDDRSRLRHVRLFVHPDRWTTDKVAADLPDGRSVTAVFEQVNVDGHWLPSKLTVTFVSAREESPDQGPADQIAPSRGRQVPRNGTITIVYSGYRVNTGLSDEIFLPKESSPAK